MIINNLDERKIKILIDETDLKNLKISVLEWLSNSSKNKFIIENIFKNFSTYSENFSIKDYSIFTYNYKVFLIILYL